MRRFAVRGPLVLTPLLILGLLLSLMPLAGTRIQPAPTAAEAAESPGVAPDPGSLVGGLARRTDLPAFGMTIINTGGLSEADARARARQMGATTILFGLLWSDIEPVRTDPPTYQWDALDANLATVLSNNLEPFMLITGNPTWAYTGQYKILNDEGRRGLAQFAAATATRYKTQYPGKIRIWSFYNEPDCNGPTVPPEGNAPSSCYGDFGGEYTKMLKEVYPALKAADSNALLAMGGLAYDHWSGPKSFTETFLNKVLETGGGAYFDLMNFHYYTEFAYIWDQYAKDVIGKTKRIQEVMKSYNVDKPIVMSEISKQDTTASGEAQADYLIQGMTRGFAAGNDLIIWYELFDDPASFKFGLIRPDNTIKPSYTAYELLSLKLTGITANSCAETSYTGIEAYSFWSNDKSKVEMVAWSSDSLTKTMVLPATEVGRNARVGTTVQRILVRDGDDGKSDGQLAVQVGPSPVILDVTGMPATALCQVIYRSWLPLVTKTKTGG